MLKHKATMKDGRSVRVALSNVKAIRQQNKEIEKVLYTDAYLGTAKLCTLDYGTKSQGAPSLVMDSDFWVCPLQVHKVAQLQQCYVAILVNWDHQFNAVRVLIAERHIKPSCLVKAPSNEYQVAEFFPSA
jgi:hypothetical protein